MDPTFRRRRASAAWILGLATATARVASAQPAGEAPVFIPHPMPPAIAPAAYGPAPAVVEPPLVRPAPVAIEAPPDEIENPLERAPLDPVAAARKGPHFFFKKIRSWHWRRAQGKLLGYPEEFRPRMLGSSVYAMGRTMASNGAEARLALHDYDFAPGSAELNERGRDQLAKAAAQLAASPYPLIVERTPDDPELAGARRRAVLDALAAASFPVAEERVLVGQPLPFGMSGVNAQIVSANALNRTQQYGPPIPINANGVNSPSGVTNQMVGVVPGQ
ncbi:hypothetical protein [Paludisphaera mucosa]|uniref:Uncharacterized protein n=1 Tax=Paludisphaera mucosa TaxID=3030827 RepID=A0ABT6FAX0_9BACT|nr:hypothetical protein [Paludisphaera mucosa]MDG3004743.1 hypothetical protein [Paludisphaera mucosa]